MSKTATPAGRKVFVPVDTFSTDYDGAPTQFTQGITTVREGHPILAKYPHMFREQWVEYDWESATAAPGEVRA